MGWHTFHKWIVWESRSLEPGARSSTKELDLPKSQSAQPSRRKNAKETKHTLQVQLDPIKPSSLPH